MLLEHNSYILHKNMLTRKSVFWRAAIRLEEIYAQIDATLTLSKFVVVPCWRHLC